MAKSAYYRAEIESARHDKRVMFRITNNLMGGSRGLVLPKCNDEPDSLAERYVVHFTDKIANLCAQLAATSMQQHLLGTDFNNETRVIEPLCDFQLATVDDIRALIVQGSGKISPGIDVISSVIFKWNIDTLAPVFTRAVNQSIESSTVPAALKHATITPVLKKCGVNPELLANYRPISNLCFISKILKRHIATQLRDHMVANYLFDVYQSAYRPAHSCEYRMVV
ncbi:MAG: hypothetical protein M3H12_08835, partial [Chromatiales bacterium]